MHNIGFFGRFGITTHVLIGFFLVFFLLFVFPLVFLFFVFLFTVIVSDLQRGYNKVRSLYHPVHTCCTRKLLSVWKVLGSSRRNKERLQKVPTNHQHEFKCFYLPPYNQCFTNYSIVQQVNVIDKYFHFLVSLSIITLHINFVIFSPIQSIEYFF